MPVSFRIKTTITIPEEWVLPIEEYKRKHGFQDYAELFRHLLKEVVIDKQKAEVVA